MIIDSRGLYRGTARTGSRSLNLRKNGTRRLGKKKNGKKKSEAKEDLLSVIYFH